MRPRLLHALIGVAVLSLAAIAVAYLLASPDRWMRAWPAVLVALAGVIIALRFAYSLRADRRYADMLEHEVAAQTRSLMDSLAATAAAERRLRLLMAAVPDAIAVLDREGRVVDLNEEATGLVGGGHLRPGRSIFELAHGDAASLVRANLEAAFAGEVRRFEMPYVREDGGRGVSSVLYAPVRERGTVTRVLALARDVTDLRRAETQLQQAEKLAALGQLVSGVAHEINNPAAIISGFAQTLLLEEPHPERRDMIKMIHDEATRIGRITANLLAFARAGGRERGLVDLNDLVRRTFALRSYHLSTLNIAVMLELEPAEPKVWGNGAELQQIVLNLLINAEQALMDATGPRRIALRTRATDGELRLDCADTGPGVPVAIRSRIFDPFFTTKPEGVGTGLGLSICYGIVQEHGGRIWVESEEGRGTTFSVVVPRDPRAEQRPAAPARDQVPSAAGRHLSVLLVDDEAGLRQAVARFLGRCGMDVRGVGDGAEALDALRQQDFDLIISDVRMPGMGGGEFLARLRRERPELTSRLIFSTGDTFAPETVALLEKAAVPSLIKPFDFSRLEALIRQVAEANAGGPGTRRSPTVPRPAASERG